MRKCGADDERIAEKDNKIVDQEEHRDEVFCDRPCSRKQPREVARRNCVETANPLARSARASTRRLRHLHERERRSRGKLAFVPRTENSGIHRRNLPPLSRFDPAMRVWRGIAVDASPATKLIGRHAIPRGQQPWGGKCEICESTKVDSLAARCSNPAADPRSLCGGGVQTPARRYA